MDKPEKTASLSSIQMDEFLRELDTPEGRQRIGDEAFKEAKDAEKRKSIEPDSGSHK